MERLRSVRDDIMPPPLAASPGPATLSLEPSKRPAHAHQLRASNSLTGERLRSQLFDREAALWLTFERGLQSTLNDTWTPAHGHHRAINMTRSNT